MSIDPARINIAATEALSAFQNRVAGIPYERKGILYSEMFFLYLCAQAAKPSRIFESGRARGQSTLLLSTIFPELQIVSIESDPSSPDVQVAQDRLRGRDNVSLRFGDATRILPAEVRRGDLILVDGPKGFRGLRLALRLLATGRVKQVFVHDCAYGTEERAFLDAHLRGPLYSDSIEFARVARVLDAGCSTDIPPDRRFDGERPPRAYGYGLACIPFDPAVSYRTLFARAVIAGIRSRIKHRVADHG
ncbi:MAG TPA: hypothetical protein VK583_12400 [Burkholderiales bacterium]|nr:hypothetical protein [Burkholderiales bacterium]